MGWSPISATTRWSGSRSPRCTFPTPSRRGRRCTSSFARPPIRLRSRRRSGESLEAWTLTFLWRLSPRSTKWAVAVVAAPRLRARLLTGFAGAAALLAAIGLYGVVSFSVASRTSEIGLRVALGAGRSEVVGLVVGQALRLALPARAHRSTRRGAFRPLPLGPPLWRRTVRPVELRLDWGNAPLGCPARELSPRAASPRRRIPWPPFAPTSAILKRGAGIHSGFA